MPSFLMEQTVHALADAVRPSGLVELNRYSDGGEGQSDDGEKQQDHPLSFNFCLADKDWTKSFGLPKPRNKNHAQAYDSVLLEAFYLAKESPEFWISYSRRKEWYTRRQRYRHPACSFATVPDVVDELTALGLLEHDQAYPGRWGKQSRFRAAPTLQRMPPPAATWEPYELIRLRNKDGKLIEYCDTNTNIRMHRTIKYFNKMLRRALITITESVINDRQGQIASIITPNDKVVVNLARNQLYRVFNNSSFNLGGRFYGPFWQNLPKSIRALLLIDGEAVDEGDYAQLHPRLLYAQAGANLEGDAYAIDGIDRQMAKRGFNIAINAETKLAAIRALALEIGGKGAHTMARDLLDALETRHTGIASYFGSGAGLRLQRHDADLAECVMLELVKRGITVLPVHDSFIVQHRHAATRDQIMDAELDRMLATLSGSEKSSISVGYPQTGPHSGDLTSLPAAPALPGWLVSGGLVPLLVPPAALTALSDGSLELPVRAALRHDLGALCMTQVALARHVGVSPAHLSKLLAGRRRASPEVGARLKTFLLAA